MTERQAVLIVDDRKENLVALRRVLSALDVEIVEASSGNEALAATIDRRFAVAILDVQMPGMSGYELAEHLRGDDATRGIPLVFVTAASTDEQSMFQGYDAGGVDYIVKPYDPKVLLGKVRVFLELDRSRRELQLHRDRLAETVTEQTARLQHLNDVLRAIRNVNQLIVREKDPETLLNRACELLVESRGYLTACIAAPATDAIPLTAGSAGWNGEFECVTEKLTSEWTPPCSHLVSVREGSVVRVPVEECAGCPLRSREGGQVVAAALRHAGHTFGVLSVTLAPSVTLNDEEASLIQEVAGDIALALHSITSSTAAARSEARYRNLFETMLLGVIYQGADGTIIDANKAAEQILGLTRDQLLGRTSMDPEWRTIHEDGSDFPGTEHPVMVALRTGKEVRGVTMGVYVPTEKEHHWIRINAVPQFRPGEQAPYQAYVTFEDVTAMKKAEDEIQRFQWLLDRETSPIAPIAPAYGDVTELNAERLILDGVGTATLRSLATDAVGLLDTSLAVYERNGDYAFGMFVSNWCGMLDNASRQLCATPDNAEALRCGKWLCHENCWNDSAKTAIASGESTDIECVGGIRLFAAPIKSGNEVVGAVNIGYGTPPQDDATVAKLATRFNLDPDRVKKAAHAYKPRPAFVIEMAKRRATCIAQTIGEILDRQQASSALRRSEELLLETGAMARVGGWEIDLETDTVIWTQTTKAIHEVPDDYVPTLDEAIGFFPEAENELTEAIRRAREEGISYDLELPFVTARGRKLWARTIGKPEFRDGQCVRLHGTFQDITEHKKAREALERSEARFRTITEASADAIFVTDREGRYSYVNDAACRLLGYTAEELCRMTIADVSVPAQSEDTRSSFQELLNTGSLFTEMELLRKDGSAIPVDLNAVLLPDGRAYGSCRDISGRREAEVQLRQAQRLESIGTLASGIAHEINNPLTGILNYAELLKDEVHNEESRAFADGIIREGTRVATIVRNILSFSRQQKETHSPAHIRDIVDASLSLLTNALRKDGIVLEIDIPDDLPKVKCRSQQIQQVVINLLSNARDALNQRYSGFDEEKRLSIVARALQKDGIRRVRMTVEDRGVGIPKEKINRIFDPFFTTKPRDEGTGLGLSVSYGIMKEHSGDLWVESEVGQYTRFHIDLPINNGWSLETSPAA